jgi:hypothetical protein
LKISNILQPLIDPGRNPISTLLKTLQVGQILEARVLQQVQPRLLRMQIGTTELLARSQVTLNPGTRVKLEVAKVQPQPELRILQAPGEPNKQQLLVRSAMPRQLPLVEVRQQVHELLSKAQVQPHTPVEAHSRTTASPRPAESLQQFANILRDAGIRLDQLSPAQVRRAVQHSGLFHEARLAHAMPPEPADTKTRLLQLLTRFEADVGLDPARPRPAPDAGDTSAPPRGAVMDSLLARLTRLVEASVSRIQLQQAATLPTEESPRQAWQIDLPVQLPDESHDLMLRIERDRTADDAHGGSTWAVNLAFQFDSIGTLQTRIGLSGERVSATFWSDRGSTHQRVEQRLPALQQAFEAQGLEVVHLSGVLGAPAESLIRVPVPDKLLDEHA